MKPLLGNTGNTTSPRQNDRRAIRFALQSEARRLLPKNNVTKCLRAQSGGPSGDVIIAWAHRERKGYFRGLQTCHQIWICPVCAQRITERRRQEWLRVLSTETDTVNTSPKGISSHSKQPAYTLTMVTFTLSHSAGQSLTKVLSTLKRAYSLFWGGKWGRNFHHNWGIIGTVRSLELTHGINGFHPHIHCLIISPYRRFGFISDIVADDMRARWVANVAKAGGWASLESGLDIKPANMSVVEYVNKMGEFVQLEKQDKGGVTELTKQPTKQGRRDGKTLTDMLAGSFSGNVLDSQNWTRATEGMFRSRHLVASRGLLKRLGAEQVLVDDRAAAEYEVKPEDVILARIDWQAWQVIIRYELRSALLAVADTGDPEQVQDFLIEVTGRDDFTIKKNIGE